MNIERLKHLRDLLRADAANPVGAKFDLGSWAAWDDGGGSEGHTNYQIKPGLLTLDERGNPTHDSIEALRAMDPADVLADASLLPAMSCNTFVCGLGLAALDPEFNKQGLTFKVTPMHHSPTAWLIPEFEGVSGMGAGARFFGISQEDSSYFFDPDCYDRTPKHAEGELELADRIDDFINGIVDRAYHPDTTDDYDDSDD